MYVLIIFSLVNLERFFLFSLVLLFVALRQRDRIARCNLKSLRIYFVRARVCVCVRLARWFQIVSIEKSLMLCCFFFHFLPIKCSINDLFSVGFGLELELIYANGRSVRFHIYHKNKIKRNLKINTIKYVSHISQCDSCWSVQFNFIVSSFCAFSLPIKKLNWRNKTIEIWITMTCNNAIAIYGPIQWK